MMKQRFGGGEENTSNEVEEPQDDELSNEVESQNPEQEVGGENSNDNEVMVRRRGNFK